jgi:hypothetical protein
MKVTQQELKLILARDIARKALMNSGAHSMWLIEELREIIKAGDRAETVAQARHNMWDIEWCKQTTDEGRARIEAEAKEAESTLVDYNGWTRNLRGGWFRTLR